MLACILLSFAGAAAAAEPWSARSGGVLTNAVLLNGGPLQRIIAAPLATEALALVPELVAAVQFDPGTEKFFQYLVQCALSAEQSVVVPTEPEPTTFEGSIGLAPEWADGPCDEACQEWVSACMFARTNAYGLPAVLHGRGPHPSLGTTPEEAVDFPIEEGAFFGNLFLDPPREYACRGSGDDPLALTIRACTLPGNRCGLQVVGPCAQACEAADGSNGGAYPACRNIVRTEDGWPEASLRYSRVVTTYLKRTSFAPAPDALPCEAAPGRALEPPPAPDPDAPVAGAPCANDADCADPGLPCDARPPGGMCTRACVPSLDRGEEAEACGGDGTTCLVTPSGPLCTRACRAGAGDCPAGRVCTGWWPIQANGTPDAAGCSPYCATDADCPPHTRCNPRHGGCGTLPDPTALADGEPCTLPPEGNGLPAVPCRGACLRVTNDPTQGICASLRDTADTPDCPDDPDHLRPLLRPGDDLGVCLFRDCATDDDCTAPLRCLGNPRLGQPRQCRYP